MGKAILALSGGMDSATVLAWLINHGREVQAVSFNYGSKHNMFEIPCAELLAKHYNVPHRIIPLRDAMAGFRSNLLMGQGEIPEGHYTDESMSQTVVPCRNLIMLSLLAGMAESTDCDEVGIGIHQGDHAIYPDCRLDFYNAFRETMILATDGKVSQLTAPFLDTDKEGILSYGIRSGVPYQYTRTCYKYSPTACGKCGSCVERLEAWNKIGMKDPVTYAM